MDELDAMAIALMLTTELAVAIACVAAWFRERAQRSSLDIRPILLRSEAAAELRS
jgi:hypothetical protein